VTGDVGATGPIGVTGATGPQGVQGVTGATGPTGPAGATGPTGATGPEGIVAQTTAPTNTSILWLDTDEPAVIPAGPTGATGPTGPSGLIQNMGFVTGEYYGPAVTDSTARSFITNNLCIYLPIYLSGTTTFDRIAVRTSTSFSGTSTMRLGIYNCSGGLPTTVVLDAGQITATATSTLYSIIINQTLNSGFYYLAVATQGLATTNSYQSTNGIIVPTLYPLTTSAGITSSSYSQTGVSGTFATAGTVSRTTQAPIVMLRVG
jgi:hypothetical protein